MANPIIRFKRDDGTEYPDWDATAFEDAFNAIGNNTLSRAELSDEGTVRNVHYGDILTVLGSIVDPVADNLPFIADETKAKKYQSHTLQDGDVIFADTAEDDTVGKAVEMKNCGSPVVSGLHTTPCRPVTGLFEHGYLGYYLNAPAYHNQLRPLMQGIKVTSVSRTAMNETELNHPTSPEEQQKIAALFTEVDNLISAASDEVSALEEAKKGMMQKTFSQEVRFKRDDGTEYPDWEEHTMAEIFDEISEKNRPELPVLSILQGVGTVLRDQSDRNIQYDKANLKGYKAMKKDDYIIHLRTFEGGLECSNYDGISSPAYRILRPKLIVSSAYRDYFRSYNFIQGKLAVAVVGIRDGKNIDMDTFWEILLDVPCEEEQQKIADFLSSMDDAIAAAKDELAGYQELKKGLLQQMFA